MPVNITYLIYQPMEDDVTNDQSSTQKPFRRTRLLYQTKEKPFYEPSWSPDRKNSFAYFHDENQQNILLAEHVSITLASVRDLSNHLGGDEGKA
jgi:hypothetical protein